MLKDIEALSALLPKYNFYLNNGRPVYNQSGLVTASTYLIDGRPVKWHERKLIERMIGNNEFHVAHIETPQMEVRFVNLHCSISPGDPKRAKVLHSQRKQLGEILDAEIIPTIGAGDFNVDGYEEGMLPGFSPISPTEIPTWHKGNPYTSRGVARYVRHVSRACDLILANMKADVISSRVVQDNPFSDHYAVISQVRIKQ